MADNGLRALPPVIVIPGTALIALAGLTVPVGKEWTIKTLRATNITAADATITVSIGAAGAIAYNTPVKVGTPQNILGPDVAVLPAGTIIQGRASTVGAIHLVAFISERDV